MCLVPVHRSDGQTYKGGGTDGKKGRTSQVAVRIKTAEQCSELGKRIKSVVKDLQAVANK